MKIPQHSALRSFLSAGLALSLLAFAAPAAHAAATLAKSLQGTYVITKASAIVDGSSKNVTISKHAPTITLSSAGFLKVTASGLTEFLSGANISPPSKLSITASSPTSFTASGAGTLTVDNGSQKIVVAISSGSIKGSVSAAGVTLSGSVKGKANSQAFSASFSITLKKK
jgi:hypothetical protein